MPEKPERQSRFWCDGCGYAIQACEHRIVDCGGGSGGGGGMWHVKAPARVATPVRAAEGQEEGAWDER